MCGNPSRITEKYVFVCNSAFFPTDIPFVFHFVHVAFGKSESHSKFVMNRCELCLLRFMTSSVFSLLGQILGDSATASWVPQAYTISTATMFVFSGNLSDIFGRKELMMAGNALALIGSIVAATAQNVVSIVVFMCFMGIATALTSISTPAFMEIVPAKHRAATVGVLEMSALPWFMFAALISNSLVGAGQFRVIYAISIIMNVIALFGVFFLYKPPKRPEASQKSVWYQLARLDWAGTVLMFGGLIVFLLGLFFGAKATTYAWNSARVVSCLVVGIVFIGLFLAGNGLHQFLTRFCHLSSSETCEDMRYIVLVSFVLDFSYILSIPTLSS